MSSTPVMKPIKAGQVNRQIRTAAQKANTNNPLRNSKTIASTVNYSDKIM